MTSSRCVTSGWSGEGPSTRIRYSPGTPFSATHFLAQDRQSFGAASSFTGWTPKENWSPWQVSWLVETAVSQTGIRNRASWRTVDPLRLGTTTAPTDILATMLSMLMETRSKGATSPASITAFIASRTNWPVRYGAAASAIRASIRTVSTGYFPMADSPESITQSV